MGFPLQSFIPPEQPYAVSDANALLMLDNPFYAVLTFRALLYPRVRHQISAV